MDEKKNAREQQLTVLVVDPNPGMRANLQNMLNQSGITQASSTRSMPAPPSSSSAAKLRRHPVRVRPRRRRGEGQDGQQLLEDLRHHKLIRPGPSSSCSPRKAAHDKVISAAELQPDRIHPQALHRRYAEPAHQRAWSAAPPCCRPTSRSPRATCAPRSAPADAAEIAQPRYAVDFARLRAELHASLKEHEQAEGVYRQ
jgi:hypothetical protein